MKLLLSLVCDRATRSEDGRFFIEGQYHDLYAPGFPAKHDLSLVAVLEWDRTDHGRHTFTVELRDPDGNPSIRGSGQTEVVSSDPSGPAARTYYVEPLSDVVFPKPGTYTFRIQAKGRWFEGPTLYLWDSKAPGRSGAAETG
ncbi:MAG: hypothetical protein RQ745_05280 [Longimicrobiales bacterium]|nr:hypothetical protein [Longimicrobiales bacterium]